MPTSGRTPGGVPLTWLPGSAAARRTWGRGHPGRIGSRRRPRSHGPEGPGGATRGSWAAGAAWDPSRLSVRPSRHRSCAPERLRDGPLPSGSAGHRPRARSALLFPPPPQRRWLRAPPRPGRLRHPEPPTGRAAGPAHSPGAPRGHPTARSAASLRPPVPSPRSRAHPPHPTPAPPRRASRAPPRGAHGPVRPASLQPPKTPATRGLQKWAHRECSRG